MRESKRAFSEMTPIPLAKTPMKEFYKRVLIAMLDVATTGPCVTARQHFAGTLSAIARDLSLVRSLWAKLERRVSVKIVRASVQKSSKSSRCAGAGTPSAKRMVLR